MDQNWCVACSWLYFFRLKYSVGFRFCRKIL